MDKKVNKLHLGCGKDIKTGFVNLDFVNFSGVDVVWDLNKFPWPFKDNTFEYVYSGDVLEHLNDLVKAMEEIYRISKSGTIIDIKVPHFASLGAFKDPTHKLFFSYYTFDYFTENFDYNFYTKARFKILKRKIVYGRIFFLCQLIANLFPRIHEIILIKFFPVRNLHFKLKVKK